MALTKLQQIQTKCFRGSILPGEDRQETCTHSQTGEVIFFEVGGAWERESKGGAPTYAVMEAEHQLARVRYLSHLDHLNKKERSFSAPLLPPSAEETLEHPSWEERRML